MAQVIKDETVLRKILSDIVEQVIEKASTEILFRLQNSIMRNTYRNEYYPNKVYFDGSGEPTFQFLNAWKWGYFRRTVNGYLRELFYDPSHMKYNPDKWLHGSFAGDARENLADILNVSGFTSGLMVGNRHLSKRREKYWDLFIEKLEKGELNRILDKEFAKFGIRRY